MLALDLADDVHDLGLVGLGTALIDDGDRSIERFREASGAGHGAVIRRNHDYVVPVTLELFLEITGKDGLADEVIHRNVEVTLDLGSVQVHGNDPVCACRGNDVRYQLGGNGISGLGLAVLAGISVIGNDRVDPSGRRALHGVDHDAQFHQVVVDRIAGGLNDIDVQAAHGLLQVDIDLSVREGGDFRLAGGAAHDARDLFRQLRIAVAREDLVVCEYSVIHLVVLSYGDRLELKSYT